MMLLNNRLECNSESKTLTTITDGVRYTVLQP